MADDPPDPVPPPAPGPPPELQFDRAEPREPAAELECAACRTPIRGVYFLLQGRKVCASCRETLAQRLGAGSRGRRLLQAGLLGLLASLLGGAVWAYICIQSKGSMFGLFTIALGYLVGIAVRKGSGGRGGRSFQVLALALTYVSAAIGYIGGVLPELNLHPPAARSATAEPAPGGTPGGAAAPERPPEAPAPQPGLRGCVVPLLMILGITLAMPILGGTGSPITYLFLAIALWQAWKLNAGVRVDFKGPFRIGGAPPGPSPLG